MPPARGIAARPAGGGAPIFCVAWKIGGTRRAFPDPLWVKAANWQIGGRRQPRTGTPAQEPISYFATASVPGSVVGQGDDLADGEGLPNPGPGLGRAPHARLHE